MNTKDFREALERQLFELERKPKDEQAQIRSELADKLLGMSSRYPDPNRTRNARLRRLWSPEKGKP